ncbi:hypothetical protein HC341_13695 [Aquisalimonas sp. 2447]|uniref:hypothetical protein n=1 Tax=Aquisalimonas sp. 2447 TaxID=2740807 RepID=UPI0014327F15|nr:hypothetical protein [Aquisalimonas sp. 2447]QIT56154.1 hypothetical protein HC341_13695 [Aquisalimonas sp. 2447]
MSDKEQLPRTAWKQEIHLVRANGECIVAVSESLLQRGLAVLVDTPLIAGEHLEVRAILPNHEAHRLEPISLECQVSYLVELTRPAARFRAGLTVTRLHPADRERLVAFIRQEARRRQGAGRQRTGQAGE